VARTTVTAPPVVPPSHRAIRRGGALLVAGAGVAALLAGCGAGQISATAETVPAVPGVNVDHGELALRNILITYPGREERTYPVGGNAPLEVQIINTGTQEDALIGAFSEAAESVELVEGDSSAEPAVCPTGSVGAEIPSPEPTEEPTTTEPTLPTQEPTTQAPATEPSAPATTPASPTSPTLTTAPASPTDQADEGDAEDAGPAGASEFEVVIPAGGCALLRPGQAYYLQLTDLTEPVEPGQGIEVTFLFREAGEVTLVLNMGLPSSGPEGPDYSPLPVHGEEEVGGDH